MRRTSSARGATGHGYLARTTSPASDPLPEPLAAEGQQADDGIEQQETREALYARARQLAAVSHGMAHLIGHDIAGCEFLEERVPHVGRHRTHHSPQLSRQPALRGRKGALWASGYA